MKKYFLILVLFLILSINSVYADTYTVKFNTNEGTIISDLVIEEGNMITKPTNPSKEGYTFAGWYTDDTFTTLFNFNTVITDNLTLYAKWNELVKEINIYSQTTTVYEGVLPSFEVTTTNNYITIDPYGEHTTWNKNESNYKNTWNSFSTYEKIAVKGKTHYGLCLKIILSKYYQFANEIKIYFNDVDITSNRLTYLNKDYSWGGYLFIDLGTAKEKTNDNYYTVKFDTVGGSNIDDLLVLANNKITIPTEPTKDGYIFEGWYEDISYTNKFNFDTNINNNITIYAKWNPNTKITYITNSTEDLSFIIDNIHNLIGIKIDDILLNKEYYNIISNDSLINIKSNYLNTLNTGIHTITFLYNNNTLNKEFTISNKPSNNTNPQTGDLIYIWIFILIISSLLLIILKHKKINL